MADNKKYFSVKPTRLSQSIASTDTSFAVAEVKDAAGEDLTSSDIGDLNWGVLEPENSDKIEFFTWTGFTDTTITGVTRGVSPKQPYSTSATYKRAHAAGVRVVLFTNAPDMYDSFANKDNNETISEVWTFESPNLPQVDTYAAPTTDEQFAPKKYVDDTATGNTNIDKLIVAATAGETVAEGDCVYFDTTDNEWKLANAGATGTSENVLLGIAQGAGTDGNTISGGVLLMGKDDGQSGFSQGDSVYLTDSDGTLGNSAGTLEVVVGFAIDADSIYFAPTYFATANKKATKDLIDAITASVAEINVLDGIDADVTTAILNEMADFFKDTDITASEAETLTDDSYADGLHQHDFIETVDKEMNIGNWITWMPMYFDSTLDIWTEAITGGTISHKPFKSKIMTSNSSGDDAILRTETFYNDGGDWDKNLEILIYARTTETTNQDIFFGFYGDTMAAVPADATDTTKHIGFFIQDGTLKASAADGTTQDGPTTIAGVTLTDWNVYRIVFTSGTDAKFYVNETLEATLNSNLPAASGNDLPQLALGVTTQENDYKALSFASNLTIKQEP